MPSEAIYFIIIITFIAGAGAGLGTGFAGMSAAVVITPMLVTFLGVEYHVAVGIALASDVFASALSAILYGKNKNIDIKNVLIMMSVALAFTVLGTYLGIIATGPDWGKTVASIISMIVTLAMGIKFIVRPVMTTKEAMLSVSKNRRIWGSVGCGAVVGLICGFAGAGGGIMMLIMLTMVLGYELKSAIGTSVFVMTFTAFIGAMAHFLLPLWLPMADPIGGNYFWLKLGLCMAFTLIWAGLAAVIANKVSSKTLNKVLGIMLIILGLTTAVFYVIQKVGGM